MQANVIDFYQADSHYHDPLLEIPEECFRWISRLRAGKLRPWLGDTAKILEFGVGSGWNLAAVPVAQRLGYDIGKHLRPVVEGRGIEFLDTVEAIEPASLPCILSHHCIEHVPDPNGVLSQIGTWLAPGGRLLLYVPFETERRYRNYDPEEINHHLYSWNVQSFANLVAANGFEIVSVRTRRFGYERRCAMLARKLGLGERGFRLLNALVLRFWKAEEIELIARKKV
jgi:SAM-dependent methyltransferase